MHTGVECGILNTTFRGTCCPVIAYAVHFRRDRFMSRIETFFRAMAWFCLGVIAGFLLAPIKKGIDVSICSNNVGTDGFEFMDDDEDAWDDPDDGAL